jgi:hypothetical protein
MKNLLPHLPQPDITDAVLAGQPGGFTPKNYFQYRWGVPCGQWMLPHLLQSFTRCIDIVYVCVCVCGVSILLYDGFVCVQCVCVCGIIGNVCARGIGGP